MKAAIFFVTLICTGIFCYGQKNPFGTPAYPEKKLLFAKPDTAITVANLSQLNGTVTDTIYNPTAYIVKIKDSLCYNYLLAIPTQNSFVAYYILKGSKLPPSPLDTVKPNTSLQKFGFIYKRGHTKTNEILKIERCKLNSKGSNALIIHFAEAETISNGPGFSNLNKGYQIWDMDKQQVLTLTNYNEIENWPYGNGMYATNTGMVRNFEYGVKFKKGSVEITVNKKTKTYLYKNNSLTLQE